MKKDVAIFSALLGAILLLGYGVYAYLYRNDERSPTYEKSVQEESTSQLENDFIEVPVLTFINERNTEASQKYTTDISYPSIALVGHSSLAKEANTVIKTFALDMLREFQKNIEEDTVDLSNAGADSGSDFTMRSNPTLLSPTIVSLRFDSVEYFAGAAHPNHQTRVLNYDIETHRIISTLDLFASSSSALPFLSTKTRENLRKRFTDVSPQEFEDTVVVGTAPTLENFESVAITPNGLLVIFNPYQVAPYARGTQEVLIPLSEISSLLSERVSKAISLAGQNFVEAIPEKPLQMEY